MDEASLKRLIAEHLAVSPEAVVDEAGFQADLGADSLDLLELTMLVENEFNIDIGDQESEKCVTVGDAIALFRCKTVPRLAA